MAGNYRGATLTIPLSGTQTASFELGGEPLLGITIPALDSTNLTISGAVDGFDAAGNVVTGALGPIKNSAGTQILTFATTTGGFTLGALALQDLTGLSRIAINSSNGQNSGARTVTIRQKQWA